MEREGRGMERWRMQTEGGRGGERRQREGEVERVQTEGERRQRKGGREKTNRGRVGDWERNEIHMSTQASRERTETGRH